AGAALRMPAVELAERRPQLVVEIDDETSALHALLAREHQTTQITCQPNQIQLLQPSPHSFPAMRNQTPVDMEFSSTADPNRAKPVNPIPAAPLPGPSAELERRRQTGLLQVGEGFLLLGVDDHGAVAGREQRHDE